MALLSRQNAAFPWSCQTFPEAAYTIICPALAKQLDRQSQMCHLKSTNDREKMAFFFLIMGMCTEMDEMLLFENNNWGQDS